MPKDVLSDLKLAPVADVGFSKSAGFWTGWTGFQNPFKIAEHFARAFFLTAPDNCQMPAAVKHGGTALTVELKRTNS